MPSLHGWADKFPDARITRRFDSDVLAFTDPDGMQLELVAVGGTGNAISRFHSVTLSEAGYEATARLLTETFGYRLHANDENCFRYLSSAGDFVNLLCQPDARRGGMGAGTIHHVAFRAETDEIQKHWQIKLTRLNYDVTPILDRQYFHSIYFREPGGVLFEIATDPPGFAIDETPAELGTKLKLPASLELMRSEIELKLPKMKLPVYAH